MSKQPSSTQGKVIRVSPEVFEALARKRTAFRSWDALMRCLLGLPPRKGKFVRLREFWFVGGSARLFESLAKAKGEAVLVQVRDKLTESPKPAKLREVL